MVPPLKNVASSAQRPSVRALSFKEFKGQQFQDQLLKVSLDKLSISSLSSCKPNVSQSITNPERDSAKVEKQIRREYSDKDESGETRRIRNIPTQFRECRIAADRVASYFSFKNVRPLDEDMLSSPLLFPDGEPTLPRPSSNILVRVTPPVSVIESTEISDSDVKSFSKDFLAHGVNPELVDTACASEARVDITLAELADPIPSEHLSHYERTLLDHAQRRIVRFQRRKRRRELQAIVAAFPTSRGVDDALRTVHSSSVTFSKGTLFCYRINSRMKEPFLRLPYIHPCGDIIT